MQLRLALVLKQSHLFTSFLNVLGYYVEIHSFKTKIKHASFQKQERKESHTATMKSTLGRPSQPRNALGLLTIPVATLDCLSVAAELS